MPAARDAVTRTCRYDVFEKLGKLVNQGRRTAHAASLEELPETVPPPGPQVTRWGGARPKSFGKARHREVYTQQGPQHAFARG